MLRSPIRILAIPAVLVAFAASPASALRVMSYNLLNYSGGRTTLNGVQQNDELGNSRLGLTFSYPWDRQHSIKLYVSEGVSVRFGEDFTTAGFAWQYRWIGGL